MHKPDDQNAPNGGTGTNAEETTISFSLGLADFLAANDISIGFTSYQTGRLYLVGRGPDGKLAVHEALYPQAMGVTANENRIYLGTLTQIVRLENVLAPEQLANDVHDKVYVPRNMQTTGNVDIHELGIREDGQIIFTNTLHNCLSIPSVTHSFKPIWKPEFISALATEDRCHLNGFAMVDGQAKYASAVSQSDQKDGWRDRRHDGGVIIDIETNTILADGLSMPHSPRFHVGRVWLLNSGTGELGWLHPTDHAFTPVAFCPGFLRGLEFHNDHAFVTLSKPRHGHFEGLALDKKLEQADTAAWCGIQILSLSTGEVAQWLRFDGPITELFDICVLPGVRNPITLGPQSNEIRDFITIEQPNW
ncbi:TIGR03032 family protein [Parasphingorhabdus cellanae]|uniref:TIGR03032 family protein n=1 Tax=Parasphingorhabdus cellanae TaxID=2806553 RepID=A0ABX7T8V2_9SPHN|nr:TIGR03032 family protein [Parasphingorhabdus cellanae]QTD56700.1 TIGR03032 family protein [Parasphingorhabdus cellanae]